MGVPLPEPAIALCRVDAKLDLELVLLGRLRNDLHALVFRHRSSSPWFILRRYDSRPLRRSSMNSGFEDDRSHDFGGRVTAGAAPACDVSCEFKVRKSE